MASITSLIRGTGREYFDLFERAGANVARAGGLLDEMLGGFPESHGLAQDMSKAQEAVSDTISDHELYVDLANCRNLNTRGLSAGTQNLGGYLVPTDSSEFAEALLVDARVIKAKDSEDEYPERH